MKIILLKDVPKVGRRYDIKDVAEGYALNLLIPRGLAQIASAQAIKKVEDVKGCHVLFVGQNKSEAIRRTLDRLKGQAILTVSDADGFTRLGGIIRFHNEEGKIRLQINVDAATEANLVISSKLLRSAETVVQQSSAP